MKPSIWSRLDVLVRKLTPIVLTLLLVVVSVMPLHVPGLSRVVPVLPLIAIYHWAVYRSELFPAYAAFGVGILQDVFTGAPLGINALVFVLVYGIVVSQHRFLFGKSFAVIWIGFGLVAGAASAVTWVLISIWNLAVIELSAVYIQYLFTFGLFPGVAWLFLRWQRLVLKDV